QLVAAVGIERLDCGQRQQGAEAEGDIRCAPDLGAGGVDRERQALAAECFRPGHRVPSRGGPALIGVGPAGCGRHLAVVELDAVFVADRVQRRQHVGGELAGFFQYRSGDLAIEIAVVAGRHGGSEPRTMIEGQQNIVDRRAVGHGVTPDEAFANRHPMKPAGSQLSERTSYGLSRPPRRCVTGAASSCGFRAFSITALLKWRDSPYRPAWPSIGALGRSQA
ncbi:hypothetical protein chiPu_0030726, partial [Chiloscyllium punctatum]|nr:hypothetical protein [Chiloscyllium punctatum]